MRRCSIIAAFVLVAAALMPTATALQAVPQFTLDLDQPASTRWDGAFKAVIDTHGWDNSIGAVINFYLPALKVMDDILGATLLDTLKTRFPERYADLQGFEASLARLGHPEVNMSQLILFPFFYEIAHISELRTAGGTPLYTRACTGILSLPQDKSLPMIHGRNMDESPAAGRNCTLNITVVRSGKPLYHIFDWTWITTGAYTSSRMGGLTLEENWNNDGSQSLSQIVARIKDPSMVPVALLFREIQEKQMTFDQATDYLMNVTLGAPAYIIMSGPGRVGHVLTLEFNKTDNVKETLTDASPVPYMVQTNYDRWKPDPPSDPRRTVAQDTLAMVGPARAATELGVWMTLSTFPVHNPHTMFSVLMSVDKMPEGYVRRAMVPAVGEGAHAEL